MIICSITASSVLTRSTVGICCRPDTVLAQIPLSADTCIGNQFCAGKLYTQHFTGASQCSYCAPIQDNPNVQNYSSVLINKAKPQSIISENKRQVSILSSRECFLSHLITKLKLVKFDRIPNCFYCPALKGIKWHLLNRHICERTRIWLFSNEAIRMNPEWHHADWGESIWTSHWGKSYNSN